MTQRREAAFGWRVTVLVALGWGGALLGNEGAAMAARPADRDTTQQAKATPKDVFPHATTPFVLDASFGAASRHFSYVDRITPELRPYDLFAAPVVTVSAELYPLASSDLPVVSGLGVVASYAGAFGLSSADADGTRVGTSWQAYDIGLRERVRLGRALLFGMNVGYGANDFSFDKPSSAAALPSVSYRFMRAALDGRGAVGPFALFGRVGYLGLLDTGTVGQLFPHASAGGLEARLGAAYAIAPNFEVFVRLDYTRFYFTMRPVHGDPWVAGGALDEMARATAGLSYLL